MDSDDDEMVVSSPVKPSRQSAQAAVKPEVKGAKGKKGKAAPPSKGKGMPKSPLGLTLQILITLLRLEIQWSRSSENPSCLDVYCIVSLRGLVRIDTHMQASVPG